ncbi:MAG: hypothetical protein HQL27_05210 [Candidatus Omnitrophica bacterium]|nr:hypothetical protein [Candidatus Omnitrophota bacterium]
MRKKLSIVMIIVSFTAIGLIAYSSWVVKELNKSRKNNIKSISGSPYAGKIVSFPQKTAPRQEGIYFGDALPHENEKVDNKIISEKTNDNEKRIYELPLDNHMLLE